MTETRKQKDRRVRISKFCSKVLRHSPDFISVTLDSNGWCDIDSLLLGFFRKNFDVTRQELVEMVRLDEKQRYELDLGNSKIRAVQGHSLQWVELDLVELQPPERLYHGTIQKYLEYILEKGLIPGTRTYVHLSSDTETAMSVARRRDQHPVLLIVEAQQAYRQGVRFFQAKNGVWLTKYIPGEFLHQ